MTMSFLQNKQTILKIAAGLLIIIAGGAVWYFSQDSEDGFNVAILTERELSGERFGYRIKYPSWWVLERQPGKSADIIMDPAKNAFIIVEAKEFKVDERTHVLQSGIMEEVLKSDKSYTVKNFKYIVYKKLPGYFADGTYEDGRDAWNFQEYVLFSGEGVRYTLRVFVDPSLSEYYASSVKSIIDSFNP